MSSGAEGPFLPDQKTIEDVSRELKEIAKGIPFKEVILPEFSRSDFEPESIRQPRQYHRLPHGAQVISRFVMERGVVDILQNDQAIVLFTEIHACAYRLRRIAKAHYKARPAANKALAEARGLVGRMESAEEELFIANRRLVVSCVKPFFWIGQVWISDFLQEGSKALTNAIRKFDFRRGTPFYAYAQIAIQNRLRNYFRDHIRAGSIGVRPTREMEQLKRAMDEWKRLHGGEVPDAKVLARFTGMDEIRIKKVRPFVAQWEKLPIPPSSLDATIGEGETSLYNFVEDPGADKAAELAEKNEIWAAIDRLPARASYIMRLRFVEGRTLEETGEILHLTRARIKQIQDESVKKLQAMLYPPGTKT